MINDISNLLRIQDLMLMAGMLDQAVKDAVIRKVPAPVRDAMLETHRRVKAAQLKAPVPVQAAFQEKFHRQDCIALATCIEYARHWMEREGKHLDEATDAGMSHLQKKLNAYIQEMDAAGEMKEWINKKGKNLVQLS